MVCLGVILHYLCNDGQFTSAIDMGDICTLCNVMFAFLIFSGCGVLQKFSKLHHLWILSDLLSYMPFFPRRTLITLDFDGIYLQSCIALLLK